MVRNRDFQTEMWKRCSCNVRTYTYMSCMCTCFYFMKLSVIWLYECIPLEPQVAQRAAQNAPASFSRIVKSRPNPLPPSSIPDSWSPRSRRGPPQMQMTPHIPDRARIGGDRSKSSNYAFISLLLSCFLTRLIRLAQKGSHSICFREVVVSQPRGFPGAWPVGSRAMFPNERS